MAADSFVQGHQQGRRDVTWNTLCRLAISHNCGVLADRQIRYLPSVCIWSLILTSSMGQTTQSWATPEAAAATEMWESEGFWSGCVANKFNTLPYTPKIMAFCSATAAKGGAIPLNKPYTWQNKTAKIKISILSSWSSSLEKESWKVSPGVSLSQRKRPLIFWSPTLRTRHSWGYQGTKPGNEVFGICGAHSKIKEPSD